MAHGYNTDVPFDGTVFHVQSERRGADAPVLETLVYCGGQIVHQERAAAPAADDEADRRLDQQHRDVVRRTRHGAYAAQGQRPPRELFGDGRSLADALADALSGDGALRLVLGFDGAADARLAGRLAATRADGSAAAGARLSARLVGPGLSPAPLWTGTAGEDGAAEVAAALPPAPGAAVIFRAESDGAAGRLRVERPSAPAADAAAAADVPAEETRDGLEPPPDAAADAVPDAPEDGDTGHVPGDEGEGVALAEPPAPVLVAPPRETPD